MRSELIGERPNEPTYAAMWQPLAMAHNAPPSSSGLLRSEPSIASGCDRGVWSKIHFKRLHAHNVNAASPMCLVLNR